MADNDDTVEVATPAGSIKVRGTDVIGVVTMLSVAIMGVFLYQLIGEIKTESGAFVDSLHKVASSQKEAVAAQKLMTCILATPEKERRNEFSSPSSFCQQISKP